MIFRVVDARRQNHFRVIHLLIGDDAQQMLNAIQPGPLLVDGLDDPLGSLGDIRPLQHGLLGFWVIGR
jgi:hypothetical protein